MVPLEVRHLASHMERLERALIPESDAEETYVKGRYPCIPLGSYYFVFLCDSAKKLYQHLYNPGPFARPSFLDVGCGIGAKVSLAMSLEFRAYGIEINKSYMEVAERLLISRYIWHGDAREYNKYKEMDIIYFYCPMVDRNLQLELEAAVYKGARDGAILIQCMKMNHDKRKEPLLFKIKGDIYLKSKNAELIGKARKFFEEEE